MKLGAELVESAKEALAIAEGAAEPTAVFEPDQPDVRTIRKAQNLSQGRFAQRYGLPLSTIRDWEQGRRRPERAACLLLRLIEAEPEVVAQVLSTRR
ncbi:DNA-binding transcriptional regulator [Poseidonocella sp. HB161398]|uniref:helix-turn-helix domain-containing protein n=1 Tax=Poseidonocella sp. HB161398 TaxID=2320855 RepID=UPI001108A0D0|nr:helix-turn-helix domain-containing protein [Poseidonocella sp. HB161398]